MVKLSTAEIATRDYYDNHAEQMAQISNDMSNSAAPELFRAWRSAANRFAKRLGQGATVLALGSGSAFDAQFFTAKDVGYVGIDLSEQILQQAKRRPGPKALAQMTMRQLAFHDKSFDGVWLWDSINNLPDDHLSETMSEVHRVLKPGGMAYINMIDSSKFTPEQIDLILSGGRDSLGRGYYVQLREPTVLANAITAAGLKIIEETAFADSPDKAFIATPS